MKKKWTQPELYVLSSPNGGADPHVNEATATTGFGQPGQGNPGTLVFNASGFSIAPDWTHAHS